MAGMRYQPQGLVRTGRANPLTRGLVSYLPLTGKSYLDAVDKPAWTVVASATPIAFDVAPRGIAMRSKGATGSAL
jgi:hypothetical protein